MRAVSSKTLHRSRRSRCGDGAYRPKKHRIRRNTSNWNSGKATSSRINGEEALARGVLAKLNQLGGKHGIGRLDLVENRYVGMKSRGCYETPGGTIMLRAHRAIESITLDREVAHLKDELMPRYAELIYNGYWWSPERRMMQTMIDASQAL